MLIRLIYINYINAILDYYLLNYSLYRSFNALIKKFCPGIVVNILIKNRL